MLKLFESIRLNLQFHAEGASGDGGGDGASGGNAADAGQVDSLESLGVPKDKVEKFRARRSKAAPMQAAAAEEPAESAAADEASNANDDDAVWEEAKKNPVINKRMQDAVNARLRDFAKKNGDNAAMLKGLQPALELIGRKVGIDVSDISKLDVNAFVKAVNDDPSYFEDLAAEMGTTTEAARNVYNRERQARAAEENARQQREEQQFRAHYEGLVQQAEELKKAGYPELDLQSELNDPWFVRVTSPSGGLTVKQAIDAKYHDRIMKDREQAIVTSTRNAMSRSIQSRGSLPTENGTKGRAAATTTPKLYSQMTKEERAIYKAQLTGRRK